MDIIYIEFNNWFSGRDYPKEYEDMLIVKKLFSNDEWCKENKICVRHGSYDMSHNWCITATREWVKKNMPELLSGGAYTYKMLVHYKGRTLEEYCVGRYSDFLRTKDKYGDIEGQFGWPFLDYCEENFGSQWYEDPDEYYDEDDDDEEEN